LINGDCIRYLSVLVDLNFGLLANSRHASILDFNCWSLKSYVITFKSGKLKTNKSFNWSKNFKSGAYILEPLSITNSH
jgi:hypothetical protein